MNEKVKAIYRDGSLVLDRPLGVSNGTRLNVVIVADEAEQRNGTSVAERLAEIADLPPEGGSAGFSGRDHDEILYGSPNEK